MKTLGRIDFLRGLKRWIKCTDLARVSAPQYRKPERPSDEREAA